MVARERHLLSQATARAISMEISRINFSLISLIPVRTVAVEAGTWTEELLRLVSERMIKLQGSLFTVEVNTEGKEIIILTKRKNCVEMMISPLDRNQLMRQTRSVKKVAWKMTREALPKTNLKVTSSMTKIEKRSKERRLSDSKKAR